MDAYDDIKKDNNKSGRIVGLIFGLIGLIFVGVGGALTYATNDFMNNALTTTGQVLNVDRNFNDGSTTYQPTFAYIDQNGTKQSGATFLSSSSYNFSIGQKMDILYDTRNPGSIRLTSWFDTWGFGILFMGIGAIPMLIGLLILKFSGSKKPRRGTTARDPKRDKYVRLESPESEEDHRRETEYEPTVRRR